MTGQLTKSLLNNSVPFGSARKGISKLSKIKSGNSTTLMKATKAFNPRTTNYETTSSACNPAFLNRKANTLSLRLTSTSLIPNHRVLLHRFPHRLLQWGALQQTNCRLQPPKRWQTWVAAEVSTTNHNILGDFPIKDPLLTVTRK